MSMTGTYVACFCVGRTSKHIVLFIYTAHSEDMMEFRRKKLTYNITGYSGVTFARYSRCFTIFTKL